MANVGHIAATSVVLPVWATISKHWTRTQPPSWVWLSVLPSVASLLVRTRSGDGAGSAPVLTADGFLLTSAHEVEGADTAEAAFTDGTTIGSDVIGRDPSFDLAVPRARGAVPALVMLGNAAKLCVG